MYFVRVPISPLQADELEAHFCEDYQQHWMLFENEKPKTYELRGYFEDATEAGAVYSELRCLYSDLPALPDGAELEEKDWKEAYKLHFKAWSDRGIHFVPVWERPHYALPEGEQIIYLDPGMAFGTGNHETTRLCLRRLIDVREEWGASVHGRSVIDAGCGSGILAIASVKCGFERVFAFDNDPDSVKIAEENAVLCEVEGEIEFLWAGLEESLEPRAADVVMANILAPILVDHRELLLRSVNPGGRLILSGILAREIDAVAAAFDQAGQEIWGSFSSDQRNDGDWGDLLYVRPE